MRLELPTFRSTSPFPCGKLLAGFCCQAPAGLRLGRDGHRREIVVICDSSKFGGDKGAYHARPRSHHPDRIEPNSPPAKPAEWRAVPVCIPPLRHFKRPNSNALCRSWWRRRELPPRLRSLKLDRVTVISANDKRKLMPVFPGRPSGHEVESRKSPRPECRC